MKITVIILALLLVTSPAYAGNTHKQATGSETPKAHQFVPGPKPSSPKPGKTPGTGHIKGPQAEEVLPGAGDGTMDGTGDGTSGGTDDGSGDDTDPWAYLYDPLTGRITDPVRCWRANVPGCI